jgi:lipoprotein-releasing system permease protein
VITLISVLGVVLGVGVLIVVISVMSGFDRQLRETLLGFEPHVLITDGYGQPLSNYPEVMERITDFPGVKGAAPVIIGPVMMEIFRSDGSSEVFAPFVRGIHPDFEKTVSTIHEDMLGGATMNFPGRVVYIGRDLARQVNLAQGDTIALHSYGNLKKMREALDSGEKLAIFPDEFVIDGVFDVGYYEFNSNFILLSLWDAQDLYGLGRKNLVHGVQVMVEDPMNAGAVRDKLADHLGKDYYLTTWTERKGELLNAIMVEKNVMFYILFFIMLVAAFGIMGTLIAFVIQKTREIGILKALGAGRAQIMGIFLSQSIFVGVIGVTFGFMLGLAMVSIRNDFLRLMNWLTGFELFPASIYQFTELPALIIPGDIAIICGGAMLMCLLAGIVPSWNAGRLKPVEALRHE